ncbi:MAG TPA: metal-dependent hydrolase [Myxococcota bacterium]|nr:metal-dependent hydrolase [Myxococcota bacterium]HRY96934.1 metal-dependent hydrolase [Myxococcota bacterium]HSA23964.1 metal-dependent hydrolase [Myxococcota bacterium]
MASLVGHALGALAVWEVGRRLPGGWVPPRRRALLLPVGLALAPDLDVVVGILTRQPLHRGLTHSFLFAALLGGLACLVLALVRGRQAGPPLWRVGAVLVACALVHPLLDFLMARGRALPWLWPLSDQGFLSPIQLLPTAYFGTSGRGLLGVALEPRTWAGVGLELLSLGGLWLAAASRRARWLALGLGASALGVGITLLLYR